MNKWRCDDYKGAKEIIFLNHGWRCANLGLSLRKNMIVPIYLFIQEIMKQGISGSSVIRLCASTKAAKVWSLVRILHATGMPKKRQTENEETQEKWSLW